MPHTSAFYMRAKKAVHICIITSQVLMGLQSDVLLRCWHKNINSIQKYSACHFIVIALMIALYGYAPIKEVSTWSISVFALLSAVLIFCSIQPQQAKNLTFSEILVWIGQRSYEMYLFHLIVLGLIKVMYIPKTTLPDQKSCYLLLFDCDFYFELVNRKILFVAIKPKIRDKWVIKSLRLTEAFL